MATSNTSELQLQLQIARREEQWKLEFKQKEDQLKRQFEEKLQRAIARKDEEHDQETKRLRLTIDQKDQQLEHKDQQLEQKDEKINQYKLNNSIAGLWVDTPKLKFRIFKCGGTQTESHVDPERLPAFTQQADFLLVTPEMDLKTLETASSLLAAFNRVDQEGFRKQTFGNDADVQGLVRSALMDAVTILNDLLGGDKLLIAQRESGIFSNRPDHLVLRVGPFQTPIFVVVTKQPVPSIDEKVWGQIYDYLGLLRVVGHLNPFVVLSTFEQSWVTWQESNRTCRELGVEVTERFKPLEQLVKYFSHRPRSGTPSPRKSPEEPVHRYQSTRETRGTRNQTKGHPRVLCTAEPYEPENLVNLFVNAISCSLANFHGSARIDRDDHAYLLKDRPVLTMKENCYHFQTISLRVKPGEFQYSHFAGQSKEGFHILDLLGSGRTSKVFLATTTEGHECVIKMYVRKFDEQKKYQPIKMRDFKENAKTSVANEKRMYRLIYDTEIPVITLFKHKCLVLPYFSPVPQDQRDQVLDDVGVLLRQNFRVQQHVRQGMRLRRTTMYYKFKQDDQRWHHCGYMTKNQQKSLFLFDLADLETCRNEEEHELGIKGHIDTLFRRNPCAEASCQVSMLDTNLGRAP